MPDEPKAVVLLSGGFDSATAAAVARRDGYAVHALTFRYGQRHDAEVAAARRVAAQLDAAEHIEVTIDLRLFGGSALTGDLPVPTGRTAAEMGDGVPVTYVPARNTIFLSYALAWAETLDAADVFLGVNALDYSGYPDCRPEYVAAYERMAALATRAGVEGRPVRIHTPLMELTKAEIVTLGQLLSVDYALTVSCYAATGAGGACGDCDACQLRRRGFTEAGVPDPTTYQPS
jgi:7-cyano-7-deazaguanine synthase